MAGKQNKENLFVRMRKSIILRLKEELEFADVKIMTHVLTVVLMICVIAATVAWFRFDVAAKIKGLSLSTSEADTIQMSLADGEDWEDVLEAHYQTEVTHGVTDGAVNVVDISMPAFKNIYKENGDRVETANSSIMAPGTYGSFSFYLKSVNTEFDSCELSIMKVMDSVIKDNVALTEEVTALFNGHILCFAQVGNSTEYQYIAEDSPVHITFSDFKEGKSSSEKVTIYWVWPYEYEDLAANVFKINKSISIGTEEQPSNIYRIDTFYRSLGISSGHEPEGDYLLAANQVFEWNQYNETIEEYVEAFHEENVSKTEKMLTEWYDYGDTLIGSYIENMVFHIQVKGVKSDVSN